MAFRNKVIVNSRTKQTIRFIQTGKDTNGSLLEMEATFNAHSKEPAPHYHPYQAEDFTIVKGALTVRINGSQKVFRQGERVHIPVNTVHSMWNDGDVITIVNWKVRPALNTDHLLETAAGLANDGKTNDAGMPGILQVSLMANKFSNVFRLAKPPYAVQKIVFTLLTPVAYLLGYKPTRGKYLD